MKTLLFDIETSPHVAYTWEKWETDVIAFKEYSHLLSFSAKWLGDKKIITKGLIDYRDKTDKSLVKDIWKLMDEADVVVSQNGVAFDTKRCFARFAHYEMDPPSPFKQIDTKLVAKRYFSFPSNSLNDLADFLEIGRKKETGGFDLWLKCMSGDKAAWKVMKEYNENDVVLLEEIYLRLRPYITSHPNLGMYGHVSGEICPKCGSDKLHSRGFSLTQTGAFRRFQCQACGGWSKAAKREVQLNTLRNE